MRFFAHDGKAVHGPAAPEELLKLPGFDGDTLVCPVGSENSADWKPSLAYPPFREALLASGPKLTPIAPPPPAAPRPAPVRPCPRCARANPEDATFCNACAARMDGRVEPPLQAGPKRAMANARETEPESALIAADPLASPLVSEIAEEAAPEAVPAAAPVWPKILMASLAVAALAGGGLAWRRYSAPLRTPPAAEPAVAAAAVPVPVTPAPVAQASPPMKAAAAALAPVPPAKPAAVEPPSVAPPAAPARATSAKRARRKARARKPKAAPAAAPEPAPAKDQALLDTLEAPDAAPAPAAKPAAAAAPSPAAKPAAPAPAEDAGFMMPGVPRRVAAKSVTKPKDGAAPADAKTDAAAADKASPPADDAADGTARQVREQFTFCAQLLGQGAYADHFDTCLCADAKQAAPYLGRRGAYAAAMKKAAAAGTLETSAAVTGIGFDGSVAKVTADWKTGASDSPRMETETWQLEEGLWCRSP